MLKNILLVLTLCTALFADVFDFETAVDGTSSVTQTVNGVTVTIITDIDNADVLDEDTEDTYLGEQNFAGKWVASDWTNQTDPTSSTMTISFSEDVDISSIKIGGDYYYYLLISPSTDFVEAITTDEKIKGTVIDTTSLLKGTDSFIISADGDAKINFFIDDI